MVLPTKARPCCLLCPWQYVRGSYQRVPPLPCGAARDLSGNMAESERRFSLPRRRPVAADSGQARKQMIICTPAGIDGAEGALYESVRGLYERRNTHDRFY